MRCQHALTNLRDLASSLTVCIIIKVQTYGRRGTECHLRCLHREEEKALKERHGNAWKRVSKIISGGCRRQIDKTMLRVDTGELLVEKDYYDKQTNKQKTSVPKVIILPPFLRGPAKGQLNLYGFYCLIHWLDSKDQGILLERGRDLTARIIQKSWILS